jgi:hypothetical protein
MRNFDYKEFRYKLRQEHYKTIDFLGTLEMATDAFLNQGIVFDAEELEQLRHESYVRFGHPTKSSLETERILNKMK